MKILLVLGILHIAGSSCKSLGTTNVTSDVINGSSSAGVVQNFTEIHSSKDLASSSSNRNAKRQSGRGSKSSKSPKVKNYSGPNGYHQVIESEPRSYSSSYHHSSEEPTKSYSNGKRSRHGTDTRDDREKTEDNDYDDDDRVEHKKKESRRRPTYTTEDDDDDSDHYDSGSKGYEHSSKYNKEKKDDYKKSGEIDYDFDDHTFDDEGRGKRKSSGGRGSSRDRHRSSNSNQDRDRYRDKEQDYHRGDASSDNRRRSKSREDDYDNGFIDEVDAYGQNRRTVSGGVGRGSRERSNRERDRKSRRDQDNDEENSRGTSRTKGSRKRDEFDFEFNAKDPYGEDRDLDDGKSRKYISSTV